MMGAGIKRKRTERLAEETAPTSRRGSEIASSATPTPTKPQLTRACAECKRHKVKCFVQPNSGSCNRCLKSGTDCVPHNLAQKFIDDDKIWKTHASAEIAQLRAAVKHLLQHNDLSDISQYHEAFTLSSCNETARPTHVDKTNIERDSNNQTASANRNNAADTATSSNFVPEGPSSDLQQENDSDLVPLPMNNLYSLTDPGSSRLMRVDPALVNGPDFITRGVVTLTEARLLFNHFRRRINPLLWNGMLCTHDTLDQARRSSPLLVATVLTVAALHMPDREKSLRATYDAFVSLMRASCLLRSQNLDDIRGFCIGSFYLTSLSWALCSRAVRVGTEMNLHKSSLQFARGCLESYERVRLWYVLYVCDHQFALAYGRPPMMHDDASIRNAEKILTSGLSSAGDRGLVAQVKLFQILAGSYFMYGCDPDLELSSDDFERLQEFNISLDQWRLDNQQKALTSTSLNDRALENGNFSISVPSKTTTLYYHLARFQLNSVALRGISARRTAQTSSNAVPDGHENHGTHTYDPAGTGSGMSWDRQEAANNAIAAATSTVRLVIDDADIRQAYIGMPIFVHAMIAVCASFLVKLSVAFSEPVNCSNNTTRSQADSLLLQLPRDLTQYGLNLHTTSVLADVRALVSVLDPLAQKASQQHVACHVVTGLKELLQRISPAPGDGQGGSSDHFLFSKSPAAVFAQSNKADNLQTVPSDSTSTSEAMQSEETQKDQHRTALNTLAITALSGESSTLIGSSLNIALAEPRSSYQYAGDPQPHGHGMDGLAATQDVPYQQNDQIVVSGSVASSLKDPFDLMGDLDWRFNDAFLWNINNDAPWM